MYENIDIKGFGLYFLLKSGYTNIPLHINQVSNPITIVSAFTGSEYRNSYSMVSNNRVSL